MLLGDIVGLNAAHAPNRVAIVAGDEDRTFGQLNERRLQEAKEGLF